MIELNGSLARYLKDIGRSVSFRIPVQEEDIFAGDFDKNTVLIEMLKVLRPVRPMSLSQLLQLGGFQLCEAGMNVARHGARGKTEVTLFVGHNGMVHLLRSAGAGFDIQDTVRKYRAGADYFSHKGAGLRSFDKPHVAVAFEDNGRAVIIKAMTSLPNKER